MSRSPAARFALLLLPLHSVAWAESAPCSEELPLERRTAVACALATNPELRRARQELAVLAGRRITDESWFPSRPVLEGTAAQLSRIRDDQTAFNWSTRLSQEVEVAGQRGARLDVVDAQVTAQRRRIATLEREVTARTLAAFFSLLAAQEQAQWGHDAEQVARRLSTLATGRAREQLVSVVDANVASAEATRFRLVALEVERRRAEAEAALTLVLGLNPVDRVQVHGELDTPPERGEPVPLLVQRALELRGDVAVAEAEVQVSQRRVSLSEREGFPNVTLSAFFAREEFDQRLIGGGISIPLPLPSPVWPSRKGEQQEQRARTAQAESDVQAVRRRVAVEVRRAAADEALRAEALRAFDAEVVAQAPKNLRELGDALSLGRLSVRDALLAQRSLIELLLGYSDARLALALANVELDRTAALLVKGDSP